MNSLIIATIEKLNFDKGGPINLFYPLCAFITLSVH